MSELTNQLDSTGEDGVDGVEAAAPGMVATSHPIAARAGAQVLRDGGNAVDAAVCAALVLGVVEPMSTGIGGDCFALTWKPGQQEPRALNGSGRAPRAACLEELERRGHSRVPEQGILSVTVPGALSAYAALLESEGSMSLDQVLAPAIAVAEEGFVVTEVVARMWRDGAARLQIDAGGDAWLVDGHPPKAGALFQQRDLGRTLRLIAEEGVDAFYRGALADQIVGTSSRLGGWLAHEDLASHRSQWVEALEGWYRGHPVYVPPPNGQGVVLLEALGILDDFPLRDSDEPERAHLRIEALKLAFGDAVRRVGDPELTGLAAEELLEEEYLASLRDTISDHAMEGSEPALGSDTVYVAAVDGQGGACSLMSSLYQHFGSGVVVEGTGVTLHNRGALFITDPAHPSALSPGRRPYHTIVPAMVFREDQPWLVCGAVGGFMQPQALVQIVSHIVDGGLGAQAAVDAPRVRYLGGRRIAVEDGAPQALLDELRRRGHVLATDPDHAGFGGAQVIVRDRHHPDLEGASDRRRDGCAEAVVPHV